MATDREYDPPAMTDEERLERKRVDSGIAFELGHPPVPRAGIRGNTRLEHFTAGVNAGTFQSRSWSAAVGEEHYYQDPPIPSLQTPMYRVGSGASSFRRHRGDPQQTKIPRNR